MIDLEEQFTRFEFQPRGVIHVGAHEANEKDYYLKLGFKKILFVEASTQLANSLKDKFHGAPNIIVAHAAIADYNGEATLRITSSDQSSSILPLALHKNIYPSIKQIGEEIVPARTLDFLLFELRLNPLDYNFLVLDIQGAELLAMMGSTGALRHIDAVQTEVSFVELYEGCALLPDIDKFMALQGFGRSVVVTPYHPSWGDAFYVRRPVISMATLGSNGRLGNQLFQYLFLWRVSQVQNALIHTPNWIGRDLFGLTDTTPCAVYPTVKERAANDNGGSREFEIQGEELLRKLPSFPSMDLYGYFQIHTSIYSKDKEAIRKLFNLVPKFKTKLDGTLEKLTYGNKKLIAIHLRRGDYGYGPFFRAPCRWYQNWIEEEEFNSDSHRVYICLNPCALAIN